jgi:putative endonuclease
MVLKSEVGRAGEDKAAAYLIKQGYRIIARNSRNKLGEIDIIARDKNVVCFIEVRTRRAAFKHEEAFASVGILKQQKLSRLAVSFLKKNNLGKERARFDVVAVSLEAKEDAVILLKNAFPLAEKFA